MLPPHPPLPQRRLPLPRLSHHAICLSQTGDLAHLSVLTQDVTLEVTPQCSICILYHQPISWLSPSCCLLPDLSLPSCVAHRFDSFQFGACIYIPRDRWCTCLPYLEVPSMRKLDVNICGQPESGTELACRLGGRTRLWLSSQSQVHDSCCTQSSCEGRVRRAREQGQGDMNSSPRDRTSKL